VRTLRKTAKNGYRSFVTGTFLYKQHVMRFGSSPQWTTLAIVASKSSNTFHDINFRFSCNILFDPMQSSNTCGLKLQTCAVAPHWGNVDFTEWEIAVCLDFPFTQATWKTTIQWLYNDYTMTIQSQSLRCSRCSRLPILFARWASGLRPSPWAEKWDARKKELCCKLAPKIFRPLPQMFPTSHLTWDITGI